MENKEKNNDLLYKAITRLLEKNESGFSEMDKIIKWKINSKITKGLNVKPLKRPFWERKRFENDKTTLENAMNPFLKIPLLIVLYQMEKETLATIISLMEMIAEEENRK